MLPFRNPLTPSGEVASGQQTNRIAYSQLDRADEASMAWGTKGAELLIVEPDTNVRDVLSQILRHEGFRTKSAANGEEALALLRGSYRPDLIILSLAMPVMNGWAFCAEREQEGSLASIPVVLLREPEQADAAAALPAADVLPKPVVVPDLLSSVRQVLALRSTR
jgi:CheY-like chemotaxis protein